MTGFDLRADDYWVMATAVLAGVACAVLGCFLVLRRLSLLGDAISHAVLPGLAVAFILTSSRAIGPMLLGAMAVGLLTAFLTSWLHRWGKVPEDASMGVVFTSLFALGVVLISRVAAQVDIDPGCVLYGLIEYVPLDRVALAGISVPRATLTLAAIAAANIGLVACFYKELKIVSFDPYLATTMGISAAVVHYALMAAVAGTTVAAFESVGSILVVSMLIAPGATAHLLTDRLSRMLLIAAVLAALSGVVGYLLALRWNTSVAGMMSVVAGAQFAVAVFFAPRYGYISKVLHRAALTIRIISEDILGMLYRWQESRPASPLTREFVLGAIGAGMIPRLALRRLVRSGRVVTDPQNGLALTDPGRREARSLVRSHRLWEGYLAKHLGLPLDHLHEPAAHMEHFVTPEMQAELRSEVGETDDPHGRRIPTDA